jgi:AraC-like DNA-binding protein
MAKASFEALNPYTTHSFLLRQFSEFTAPYHFHPEYELTLIVRGKGNRYVGNHMATYEDGDLVLLGSNLPHCWKNEPLTAEEDNVSAAVIQFAPDFLGNDFLGKPELSLIARLLQKSMHGIQFTGKTAGDVKKQILTLTLEENSFKRLLGLLDILYALATSKDYTLLDQQGLSSQTSGARSERINAVLGYIIDNYKNEILLDEAAALVSMTPNAFCKYYKKTTKKTFIETVTDYRINYAIQQLIHSDRSIFDICFDNGFGDLSHFYKLFKRKMKLSPLKYRKEFRKDL